MTRHFVLICIGVVMLAGCGHRRHVIVDMQGVDRQQYQHDLFECREYARQVDSRAGKGAVAGAVVGGAIGAVVGDSTTMQKGAGVGAISGLVKGGASTRREKQQVVKNCLRGRGYQVLN